MTENKEILSNQTLTEVANEQIEIGGDIVQVLQMLSDDIATLNKRISEVEKATNEAKSLAHHNNERIGGGEYVDESQYESINKLQSRVLRLETDSRIEDQ